MSSAGGSGGRVVDVRRPSNEGPAPNPSGLCMCGCGEPAPIARYSRPADGIKQGQHCRYIKGHWARTQQKSISPPNPSGVCACGCGGRTPLATRNRADKGIVKGQPLRYVPGHAKRGRKPLPDDPGPNPSGLCMCGCGQKTSIALASDAKRFEVRGRPMRYLKGHNRRGKEFPPRGERLAMIRASQERRAKVVEEYRQGMPLHEIAKRHGFAEASSVGWAVARARAEGEDIERRRAVARPRLSRDVARRLSRMWRTGRTASEMRAAFGWNRQELSSAVAAARLEFDLPRRSLYSTELSSEEGRSLKKAARRVEVVDGLTDRQRTLLRLIQASERPVSSGGLAEVLCLLGYRYAPQAVLGTLGQMKRKELVASVPSGMTYRHAPRWLWFVPLDREQPAAALTLADAQRETELAALIREQEEEVARGDWARVDPKTISLDATFGEDGGTFHDLLAAGDEPFKAGVIER